MIFLFNLVIFKFHVFFLGVYVREIQVGFSFGQICCPGTFNVSCSYSDKGIVKYDDFGHVL